MFVRSISSSCLFLLASGCWAATYDAAADFEQGWVTHSNPNGVWTYGYSSGFTGPFTAYDQTAQGIYNGPNTQFWLSSSVNIGGSPAAEFNNGPAYADGNVSFLANEFLLVAGIGGQYSNLIFTAPTSGTYSVSTSFRGAQNTVGTVVGVTENSTVLFSSSITALGQTAPFVTTLNLAAGDRVVFSVGPGDGSQNTGVSATITSVTSVPEPSSLAVAGTAILVLVGLRNRLAATVSRSSSRGNQPA